MNIARFGAAALAATVFFIAAGNARAVVPASHVAVPMMGQPAFALPDNRASDMQYCRSTGGIVEHRIPEYGTNNPNPLVLSGSADFCQYTAKDKSRIHILLTTLNATLPTLAALAYYAHPKLIEGPCTSGGANPASCYCTQLGGSDLFGGANLGGGSWVGKGVDADLEACVFPDMSSIDSWGLAYRSNGTIRGIDLSKVLKYKKPK